MAIKNTVSRYFWSALVDCQEHFHLPKTLFLAIFDPRSSIVKGVFVCHLPGVIKYSHPLLSINCPLASSSTIVKDLLLRNLFVNQSQILCGASVGWGKKVCSNGLDHMTKMTAVPIYGKILIDSSSTEPKGQWPWDLVYRPEGEHFSTLWFTGCLVPTESAFSYRRWSLPSKNASTRHKWIMQATRRENHEPHKDWRKLTERK